MLKNDLQEINDSLTELRKANTEMMAFCEEFERQQKIKNQPQAQPLTPYEQKILRKWGPNPESFTQSILRKLHLG